MQNLPLLAFHPQFSGGMEGGGSGMPGHRKRPDLYSGIYRILFSPEKGGADYYQEKIRRF
jgi:hypothetical protein